MSPRKNRYLRELEEMLEAVNTFQKRVDFIQSQGVNVDQITPLLSRLATAADALIAKGAGAITKADVQTIVDSLTSVATKLEAAAV